MRAFNTDLLSAIDRGTKRFSLLNTAVSMVMDKVAPQITAAACGNGDECDRECGVCSGGKPSTIRIYASSLNNCYLGGPYYRCTLYCGVCAA